MQVVDADDGRLLSEVGASPEPGFRPAIVAGRIVFARTGLVGHPEFINSIACLDAASGTIVWGKMLVPSCLADDARGNVLVGLEDGWLCCLDGATGHETWRRRLPSVVSSVMAVGEQDFIASCRDGTLIAISLRRGESTQGSETR